MDDRRKIIIIDSESADIEQIKQAVDILIEEEGFIIIPLSNKHKNQIIDDEKRKLIKWNEKMSISEYIKNPDNIRLAMEKSQKLFESVKEYKHISDYQQKLNTYNVANGGRQPTPDELEEFKEYRWDGWCSFKDIIEATTMVNKEANEIIDLLYVFGLIATVKRDGKKYYRIFQNLKEIEQYINVLLADEEAKFNDFKQSLYSLKEDVIKKDKILSAKEDKE